jgi:hypothetical protein
MGRLAQFRGSVPVDAIFAPPGPVSVLNSTDTSVARWLAASSVRLKLTTSLRAPKTEILLPSQVRLMVLPVRFWVFWRYAEFVLGDFVATVVGP